MQLLAACGRTKMEEELAKTRQEASQKAGLLNSKNKEKAARLMLFLLSSICRRRLSEALARLMVFTSSGSDTEGLLFPGIIEDCETKPPPQLPPAAKDCALLLLLLLAAAGLAAASLAAVAFAVAALATVSLAVAARAVAAAAAVCGGAAVCGAAAVCAAAAAAAVAAACVATSVSDQRTRVALAAIAQAKQDAAVVRNIVGVEAARLEAERTYLSRWRSQLVQITEEIDKEAVQTILEVSCRKEAQLLGLFSPIWASCRASGRPQRGPACLVSFS